MSFWANKLNGTKPSAPVVNQGLYLYTPQPTPQQTVPVEAPYTPTVKLTQGSTCPGCGSNSYKPNHGSYALACPECGYHPRFEQTGYGEGSLNSSGQEVAAARQINQGGFSLKGAVAELNSGGGFHMHQQ